jgi:hypothetical protein
LINPNLNFFVSVILLDLALSQSYCVQNYSIRCLSRDARRFWDTVYFGKKIVDIRRLPINPIFGLSVVSTARNFTMLILHGFIANFKKFRYRFGPTGQKMGQFHIPASARLKRDSTEGCKRPVLAK